MSGATYACTNPVRHAKTARKRGRYLIRTGPRHTDRTFYAEKNSNVEVERKRWSKHLRRYVAQRPCAASRPEDTVELDPVHRVTLSLLKTNGSAAQVQRVQLPTMAQGASDWARRLQRGPRSSGVWACCFPLSLIPGGEPNATPPAGGHSSDRSD